MTGYGLERYAKNRLEKSQRNQKKIRKKSELLIHVDYTASIDVD